MGGKSAPDPPDYRAAAEETAESSKWNTQYQTSANRPTQITPWGTVSWNVEGQDTNRPMWTQEVTLSGPQQAALDAQMALQSGRSDLALSLMSRAEDEFGDQMDWSQFDPMGTAPQAERVTGGDYDPRQLQTGLDFSSAYDVGDPEFYRSSAEDALYGKAADRLDARFGRKANDLEVKLRNQGLRPGDEAYDRAMTEFSEVENDAYQRAIYDSIIGSGSEASRMFGMGMGLRGQDVSELMAQGQFGNQALSDMFGQELAAGQQEFKEDLASSGSFFNQSLQQGNYETQLRQQQIAEEMQRRGFSLNEINAIITGQQVGMPSQPSFQTATKADTADYLGAANMGYQADLDKHSLDQASDQAMMQGVASAAMMFSDRRLKTNIKRIGSTPGGTPLYSFNFIWGTPSIGVMSDEVPHAVAGQVAGYDVVDYRRVK